MFRTWWQRWRQRTNRSSPASRRSPTRRGRGPGIQLEPLEERMAPAIHTWIGRVSTLWSDNGNWMGGTPSGDEDAEVIFDALSMFPTDNRTSVNNLGNITIRNLQFWDNLFGDFIISSLPSTTIKLKAGIIDDPLLPIAANNQIASDLVLIGATTHTVEFLLNAPRTISIRGAISAETEFDGILKSGPGELALFGNNTFQGGVSLQGSAPPTARPSIVTVGHDRALGIGTLTLDGGTLRADRNVTLANPVVLSEDSLIAGIAPTNASLTFTGPVLTAVAKFLTVESYAVTTFTGNISGGGVLSVDAEKDFRIGRGKVVLSGNNSFVGGVIVTSGILAVTTSTALGTSDIILVGGTLQSDNPNTTVVLPGAFAVSGNARIGGTNSLTILGNGIIIGTSTLTLANTIGIVTLAGNIFGTGSLAKEGAGVAILNGDNTYEGRTTLRGGVLGISRDTGLGTSLLDFAGGTLRITAPVTLANTFQVSGDSALDGNQNVTFAGPGTFTGSVTFTLTIRNSASTTFSNVISGVGAIRIEAGVGGIVNFFGVNTYSGGTTLSTGTITVNSDRSLGVGTVFLNGGSVQANANVTLPNVILVNGNPEIGGTGNLTVTGSVTLLEPTNIFTVRNLAVVTFTNVINGSGRIGLNSATGTLNLPAVNTFTGGIVLTAGTLVASNNLSFGTGLLALNGGRLLPTRVLTLANAFTVGGAPVLDAAFDLAFTGFGNLLGTSNLTVRNNAIVSFTHSAFINMTGTGGITKLDGGTLVLTSNSDYRGGVTLNAGVLRVGHNNALGTGTFTFNGGTIQADTPVTLPNTVNVNGAGTVGGITSLTFGGTGTTTLAGTAQLILANTATTTINQIIRGAGALVVTGGTAVLNGANTYTGMTTVNGGTLLVNGVQPASAITVNSADLGGTGTTGPVTLRGSNLRPGVGPGVFRASGNVSLNSTSTFVVELAGATAGVGGFDQQVVTGTVDLNSDGGAGSGLELVPSFAPAIGGSFTILQTTAGVRGTFRGLPEGSLAQVGDLSFRITYRGGASGTDIVLTRVLTNSTVALVTSLNPTNPGRAVTFTATVAGSGGATGVPTGTVTFMEGQNLLGIVPLVNGRATVTTNTLTVGSFLITASYSGDGNFTPGGPTQLTQSVAPDLGLPVNQRFVSQLYRDLLGREADPAGLAAFQRLLDQNQLTRAGAVQAIQGSQEYRDRVVRDLYRRILGREADPLGLAGWSAFLGQGGTSDRLQALLMESDEFFRRFGGTQNGFLNGVYQTVLGRTPDTLGQQLWLARINAGSPRGAIAEEILASPESNRRRVEGLFRQLLRRPADTNGLNALAGALQNGATFETITAVIMGSEEYYLRA